MATDAPALDPRIEEVLRDIAADPRAKLFTCDVERMVRGLGSAPVHASLSTAGLTSAERHLLTIGREEVARLLLIAFRERLEVEQDGSFLYTHERMPRSEWRARAEAATRRGFDGSEAHIRLVQHVASGAQLSTRQLLEACIHFPSPRAVDRADLLAASQRLSDRQTSRVYLGIDLVMRGRHSAARQAISAVLSSQPTSEHKHYALAWHAMMLGAIGDSFEASREFVRAVTEVEAGCVPDELIRIGLLSAMWYSVRSGDAAQLRHVIKLLELVPPAPAIDAQFVAKHRNWTQRDQSAHGSRGSQQARVMQSIADSNGGVAKEIVYVALS